jgi:signal transduction histidine kinase
VLTVPRSLWHEPRPAGAPPVGRTDLLLAGAYAVAAVLEGLLRPDVALRPVVLVLALVLVPALLWRRDRPLVAVLLAWGVAAVLSTLQLTVHDGDLGLTSMLVVVVPLYSLVRWGSGREVLLGIAYVAGVVVLGLVASAGTVAEVLGGSLFVLLVADAAAVVRYRADLWRRQQREIRNQERVALARELHDTVAHHVSAIAVQAQAGGAVVGVQPERAVEVLAAIESEASRTLAEMRSMVRVLREEEDVDCSPQRGAADLPGLASGTGTPVVEVSLDDAVSGLSGPVDAAVYRLAQESLTNALRHARGATHVRIDVRREGGSVRLLVTDDGRGAGPGAELGFGLLGMTERAQLLGGSFTAGPGQDGGWVVEAVLPA